ncbi:hypothetical protein AA313_de0203070 [Arthrobotrys entomopaga]|nr:hypothetical protein AA313_de0203070 [Arthrobotrys entomopaga]
MVGSGSNWILECRNFQAARERWESNPGPDEVLTPVGYRTAFKYNDRVERCFEICICVPIVIPNAASPSAELWCFGNVASSIPEPAGSTASGRKCRDELGCVCIAHSDLKLAPLEDPSFGGDGDGGPWRPPPLDKYFQEPKTDGSFGSGGGTVGANLGRFSLGIGGSSGGGGSAYQQHRQLAPGTKEPYWLYGPQSSIQLYFLAALGGLAGIGGINGRKGGSFNPLFGGISKRELGANTCPAKSLPGENANGGTQYYDPKFNSLLTTTTTTTTVDEKQIKK